MTIDAVVFDFDGLVLDTETPTLLSWQEVYREHGCELTLDDWSVCLGAGRRVFDPYRHLESLLGRSLDHDAIRARRKPRFRELLDAEPMRPGVRELLDDADRLGLKIGMASSSDRAWVTGHLERLGLIDRFECIVCEEDVSNLKPDPELFATAVGRLGVAAERAVALEDSPNGVLAAKRAGLHVVAVPNPTTRTLEFPDADLTLGSLAEIPLGTLIERLA